MDTNYLDIPQVPESVFCTTINASEDTTLGVTHRTNAFRIANLTEKQAFMPSHANGAFVSVSGSTAAETGTLELWGYSKDGSAELLGIWTYTLGTQTSEDGGVYADAIVLGTAGMHTVTILGAAIDNGKGELKFDTLGFKYIVGQITAITGAALATHKLHIRPW